MTQYAPITTIAGLEEIYNASPTLASTAKEADHLTAHYRALLEASPFLVLATVGPEGMDCSPRGDGKGFVRVEDERTLVIPDRRGNNRIDSLRNILRDPRVALLFLIPGSGTTLRVNGRAQVTKDVALMNSFAVAGKLPRTAIIVNIETVYFQCARAVLRADLWNPDKHVDPDTLPTPGKVLQDLSSGKIESQKYDLEWPDRAKLSMW
jgi:uncharacterized protein